MAHKNNRSTDGKPRQRFSAAQWLGGTVGLQLDASPLRAKIAEVSELTQSLEHFSKRLFTIGNRFIDCGLLKSGARVSKPALRAGHLLSRLDIKSSGLESLRSALRALNLNVAHKIL